MVVRQKIQANEYSLTIQKKKKKKATLIQLTEQSTFSLLFELPTFNFQYLKKPRFPEIIEIENKYILTEPNYNVLQNKK